MNEWINEITEQRDDREKEKKEMNAGIVSILTAEGESKWSEWRASRKKQPTDWNYLLYGIELIFASLFELAGIWFILFFLFWFVWNLLLLLSPL